MNGHFNNVGVTFYIVNKIKKILILYIEPKNTFKNFSSVDDENLKFGHK